MKEQPDFLAREHDPLDPNPWLALYLDRSTPLPEPIKRAWLSDSSSRARQFLLRTSMITGLRHAAGIA